MFSSKTDKGKVLKIWAKGLGGTGEFGGEGEFRKKKVQASQLPFQNATMLEVSSKSAMEKCSKLVEDF